MLRSRAEGRTPESPRTSHAAPLPILCATGIPRKPAAHRTDARMTTVCHYRPLAAMTLTDRAIFWSCIGTCLVFWAVVIDAFVIDLVII